MSSTPEVTVCIPTIPPRKFLLERALHSVRLQKHPASAVVVSHDEVGLGAAATRQKALNQVKTEWVAFLDDDDEMLPEHLDLLLAAAQLTAADYVYSWYHVIGGSDPRPDVFGQVFDPCNPVQTTITTLVRTELAQATGFLADEDEQLNSPDRHYAGEDWRFTLRCIEAGAHIYHTPYKTWLWHHDSGNTSGLAKNWQNPQTPSISYPVIR